MDVHDMPNSGHELRRRLNFEYIDDISQGGKNGKNEIEMQNMSNENETNDLDINEKIREIHGRIPKALIPEIGMEFANENAAYEFYKAYAKACGFSTRISRSHKDKFTGKRLDRVFCCSKQGERKKDKRDVNVQSHRPLTRCNCPAEVKISCRQTNARQKATYRIVKFVVEHSHDCVTPSKSHLFRSHRKMDTAQKQEVDTARSCGISLKSTMELMMKQSGGPEHLGFISDDCKNYLRTKRMTTMGLSDTGGVLEYLQRMQAEDPQFFYAIQVDEDALITNFFWQMQK